MYSLCLGQPEPFLTKIQHPTKRFAILNPYVTVSLIISPIQLSSVSFQYSDQQFFWPCGAQVRFKFDFFEFKKIKSVLCENMTFLNVFPMFNLTPLVFVTDTLMKKNIDT